MEGELRTTISSDMMACYLEVGRSVLLDGRGGGGVLYVDG